MTTRTDSCAIRLENFDIVPVAVPSELSGEFIAWLVEFGQGQFRSHLRQHGVEAGHVKFERQDTCVMVQSLSVNGSNDNA